MTRTRHMLKRIAAAAAIIVFAISVTGILVVRSGWFRERIREEIVTAAERATGGHVELGAWSFNWTSFTFRVSPFVLHGTEAQGEEPLVQVQSVTLGMRLISIFERKVDLNDMQIVRPRIRIVFYPDGSNNIPMGNHAGPKTTWAEDVLDLKVRHYDVINGMVECDVRQVPLDLHGDDLRGTMIYDPKKLSYLGSVSSKHLRTAWSEIAPVEFDLSADFALLRSRLDLTRVRLATGRSRIDAKGTLTNLRTPGGLFDLKATVSAKDAVPLFHLPITTDGSGSYNGTMLISFAHGFDYSFNGKIDAQGLGLDYDRIKIRNAGLKTNVQWTPQRLSLADLDIAALGARMIGNAELVDRKQLRVEGTFDGLSISEVVAAITDRPAPWDGSLTGMASLETTLGSKDALFETTASISPTATGPPLEGAINLRYDQRAGTVELGNSRIATPTTSLDVSGTLGRTLMVRARSTQLEDFLPAIALAGKQPPARLPVFLNGGEASAAGAVTGTLDKPKFRGDITVTKATVEGHSIDRLAAGLEAEIDSISLSGIQLARGPTVISGDARIASPSTSGTAPGGDWMNGRLSARLDIVNAPIADLAKEFGITDPLSGTATATLRVSGTPRAPEADVTLDVSKPSALGEQADRLRGTLHYQNSGVSFSSGLADLEPGRIAFSGSFTPSLNTWRSGDLKIEANIQNVSTAKIASLTQQLPNATARLDGKGDLEVHLQQGQISIRSLNADVSARGITLGGDALSDLNLKAATKDNSVAVQASAQLLGASMQGQGSWRLEGDYPGTGTLRLNRVSLATLHDVVMFKTSAQERAAPPPFDGFIEGGATFSVALKKPEAFLAEARIDSLQLNPAPNQALRLGVQAQDVVVKNTQPITLDINAHEARVRTAQFTARNTSLELTGAIPFGTRNSADLAVKGSVNLAILQLLNPDLLAKGDADMTATIRGSLQNPQLSGRMALKGASLYLADVPSGIDSANGVILFDRNRATIDNLTAETGGGKIGLHGFLEFGEPLIYRIQAEVRQVRVRYPQDVSMTMNADLSLNGTSAASLLSGSLTLNRATITAGSDFGSVLASSLTPSTTAVNDNDYLRGVRFDVHIESSPTFELETSLTRNTQASVDLRLRGTPGRPALLGEISVNSGEIQMFGSKYAVNRGDVRFMNPVRIEPTLDVNLETRSRGITVNVSLSGSPQRLNVNYSSDPPLQTREIIALLAVGRDPSSSARLADTSTNSAGGFGDTGGLLGQAVSEQLSSRMQRFFGASRVKIDPTLTGVDNLPQARLTLDQQVSRDITLTYVTNLNRTQEQIVRVEWDFNQQWSAVALRDSNGLFGIDIQFRKRFK